MIRHSETSLTATIYELLLIMEEHYLLGRTETELSIAAMLYAPLEPTLQNEDQAILCKDILDRLFEDLTKEQNLKVEEPGMPLDLEQLIHLYEHVIYGEDLAAFKDALYRRWKDLENASDSFDPDSPAYVNRLLHLDQAAPIPEFHVSELQIAVLSEMYLYMGIVEGFQLDGRRIETFLNDLRPPEYDNMGLRLHQMEDSMHYIHLYEKTLHQVKGRNVRYDDINAKYEFVWTEDGVEVVEK